MKAWDIAWIEKAVKDLDVKPVEVSDLEAPAAQVV